jgi:hypothetical protein
MADHEKNKRPSNWEKHSQGMRAKKMGSPRGQKKKQKPGWKDRGNKQRKTDEE